MDQIRKIGESTPSYIIPEYFPEDIQRYVPDPSENNPFVEADSQSVPEPASVLPVPPPPEVTQPMPEPSGVLRRSKRIRKAPERLNL